MEVNIQSQDKTRKKVLVVDDNEQLLSVVRDVLDKNGFDVKTASGAQNALGYLESETPNIILCDIMMPDVSGLEFFEQLKDISHLSTIPFVFLTALSDQKDINVAKELGCDGYLTKPFNPEDLLAIVRGKLRAYKKRIKIEREKADAERRKIVHTLSHEFRTPLVSINSGAELLLCQHEQLEDQQVSMLLRSIIRGGQRLQSLVDDFVLLQQIDSGQAKQLYNNYKRSKTLSNLVDTALIEFRKKNAGKGSAPVEVIYNTSTLEVFEVEVYDVQIISALERVLSNGSKFAGKDKPLTLLIEKRDDHIVFTVRDRGPGLPEEMHKEVFELFQQVNRTYNEQQGAGLGLSIASYFAKINGGKLLFSTPKDGVGLEVEMYLPCKKM